MIPLRHVVVLFCLFAVTFAIRWPNLGRPMSKHHEFCTATALRVLTVWHQEGIASKGYNPATNFAGAANKYINNHASGSGKMIDGEGNYYYVSHPPLAYYLPYATFSLLHIEPDVLPLQYFNLFINLLCGFGIYLLARRLLPGYQWVGVVAALVYWFTPAALWFQSNVYMSDMMAQPFYIGALLLALYVKDNPRALTIVALALICFLGTYNTWFGMLVAGSLGVYFIFKAVSKPVYLWVVGLLVLSQVLVLWLIAWQYSQIAGWDALSAELVHRFGVRGKLPHGIFDFILSRGANYLANYGALVIFIPFLFLVKLAPGFKPFLVISLLPIFLMHAILAEYTGHDFTTLYLAVPLSVLVAMLTVGFEQAHTYKGITAFVIILSVISGPMFYQIANPYGEHSFKGDNYNTQMIMGLEMGLQPKDAIIFYTNEGNVHVNWDGIPLSPEMLWYAKRNVKQVGSEHEALDFLKLRSINTGVIFEQPYGREFQVAKIISLQSNH